PQFHLQENFRFDVSNFGFGLTWFALGLAKKILFADVVAQYATPIFNAAAAGQAVGPGRWLDRGLRLRAPTLLRFLRLHRHGDWLGADDRRASAAQFRLALQGAFAGRFLAALAHDAVEVPARLSLHPARRQSKGTATALYQSFDHDAAGRLVARCRVDLRDLGRHSWLRIGRKSRMEQGSGFLSCEPAQSGGLGTHARFRDAGVGSVSSR